MNLFGYVVSAQTPVTAAQLENDGVTPTGSASAVGLFNFPNTGMTATFQPGVPEPATWMMLLIGFAGVGFAGRRRAKTQRTSFAVA